MKKPKSILHLGTYKTGSSAIQKLLAFNRNLLLKNKILYPKFSVLPEDYVGGPKGYAQEYVNSSAIKHQKIAEFIKFRNANHNLDIFQSLLSRGSEGKEIEQIIVSSEHLWSGKYAKNTIDLLLRYSRDCTVLIYLRNQAELISSYAIQQAKSGHITDEMVSWKSYPFLKGKGLNKFMYYQYLAGLREVGEISIIARPYLRHLFTNNDVTEDVLDIIGFNEADRINLKRNEKVVNPNLGRKSYGISLQIATFAKNQFKSDHSIKKLAMAIFLAAVKKMNKDYDGWMGDSFNILNESDQLEIMKFFGEDNRQLNKCDFAPQADFWESFSIKPQIKYSPFDIPTQERDLFLEYYNRGCKDRGLNLQLSTDFILKADS